ncbi:MAG: FAD-dependent oxidoreductase, partial [Solirubrobacterales bacterium]|nr:FAD-dependent oxidoreductase [Solirubrobacterales bacterium]
MDLGAAVNRERTSARTLPGDASPTLTDHQIDLMRPFGRLQPVREGDVLFEAGDADYDFYVVTAGEVAVVDQLDEERRTLATHRRGEFVGDMALLSGGIAFATAVVTQDGELLRVPAPRLREIVEQEPALSELIVHALLLRRSQLVSAGGGVEIIGSPESPDTQRLRRFLRRNGVPHAVGDALRDERAHEKLTRAGATLEDTPAVLRTRARALVRPTEAELARALGLGGARARTARYDLLIVGSGPAGLAASVYAASDGLAAGTVEALAPGGQAATSPRIENYLGFPAGVSGAELTQRALIQAVKFGAEFLLPRTARTLSPAPDGTHLIGLDDGSELIARHVILATGARYRRLEVPGATRFEAFGLFYGAMHLDSTGCRGQEVVVVGGGNSAGQAALSLSAYASRVHLLVRRAELSATMSHYLIERIAANPRVALATSTQIVELRGEDRLEAAVLQGPDGQAHAIRVRAVYALLGAEPHTEWMPDAIERDRHGFVLTGESLSGPARGTAEWAAAGR